MIVVESIAELRDALAPARRAGRRLGLVPTMGAFHDGHLSLMRHAVDACDEVVVSLFVNPTQFNDAADLAAYPRDQQADAQLADTLGVDWLFAPPVARDLPGRVRDDGLGRRRRRAAGGRPPRPRPLPGRRDGRLQVAEHRRPDVAYFGAKDAQQLAVIRRMVSDLDIRAAIEALPTVRAGDGLALSSRNALLSPADRERAPALQRALIAVADAVAAGERDPERALARRSRGSCATAAPSSNTCSWSTPRRCCTCEQLDRDALAVIAARFGTVRLIDNTPVPLGSAETTTNQPVATPIGAPTN